MVSPALGGVSVSMCVCVYERYIVKLIVSINVHCETFSPCGTSSTRETYRNCTKLLCGSFWLGFKKKFHKVFCLHTDQSAVGPSQTLPY